MWIFLTRKYIHFGIKGEKYARPVLVVKENDEEIINIVLNK